MAEYENKELLETKHANMVNRLAKDPFHIIDEMTDTKADLWHQVPALVGEAAELMDIVKKFAMYNKPWTKEQQDHAIEELGDIEFYLERIRQILEVTREETLRANITKLSIRYPGFNFTNLAANERADKAGGED